MKLEVENNELREIIEKCAKDNRAAQEELFKLFYGKMMGVCMRYTKDRDRAQEVVQEGFIKVFDKLSEFDFKGSFEGWMRRIMVNASIDAIRKRNRQPFSTDEEYMFNDASVEQEDDSDEMLTKLKAEYAMEAIQSLSPAYQTVFNLYVIENYSHKEIAEILGVSEGTSKSNLAKAKQNLRSILKEKFVKLDR
ncbi:MAG: RNA polymerase subunit sigma-70 [Fluviicola sp.]|nr:MAG: RNA polymerase subunit sigma-70 [Fluviicola sp.]